MKTDIGSLLFCDVLPRVQPRCVHIPLYPQMVEFSALIANVRPNPSISGKSNLTNTLLLSYEGVSVKEVETLEKSLTITRGKVRSRLNSKKSPTLPSDMVNKLYMDGITTTGVYHGAGMSYINLSIHISW